MSRGKSCKTIERLKAAIEILEEIQPATVRAICYRLFVLGLIPNMSKSSTNSISRILTQAREAGDIVWAYVVDETREAETSGRWNDTGEFVRVLSRGYRRDYWQDQPTRVEVWSEKGTVRGTIQPVLDEYGVTFRVMHGYGSATAVYDAAQESLADNRPMHVIYIGDWDPSGLHMSMVDLPERIDRYLGVIDIERIALLEHDLKDLPTFSPGDKRKDPRYPWFMREIGTRCAELDALPPPELRGRLQAEIEARLDIDLWNRAIEVERVERESIEQFSKQWQGHDLRGGRMNRRRPTNFIDGLKRKLREDQLALPTAFAIETLADLTGSLMNTQAALLRASTADEFAKALAALHGELTEAERAIAGLVAITRDRNAEDG